MRTPRDKASRRRRRRCRSVHAVVAGCVSLCLASVEASEGFLIVRPAMGAIEFAANAASRVAS
jgi:hypothetical protein